MGQEIPWTSHVFTAIYISGVLKQIDTKEKTADAPALVHREMELTTGLIRDLFTEEIDRVVIDSEEVFP